VGPSSAKSILLVDDDRVSLAAVGKLLERWGYQVTTCADSGEAVSLALKGHWDTIVLDLGLPSPNPERIPDFSGFKMLRWLTLFKRPIPVIIFTNNGKDGLEAEAITAGAFALIRKDEAPRKLAEAVQLALDSRGAVAQLPSTEQQEESTCSDTRFTSITRFFTRLSGRNPGLVEEASLPRS
jgi:CheY-like chemotaxis protein